MICCVSLNPAVDKYLRLSRLERGAHQQAEAVVSSGGGKAVNVAGVLRRLRQPVVLLGLFGGASGDWVRAQAAAEGIEVVPVITRAPTRTAFVLVEHDGRETEVVEPGGPIAPGELRALRMHLRRLAPQADAVVLSGSVPRGCPDDVYVQLLADCGRRRVPILLDTSRQWLRAVFAARSGPRPTLLKPNRREAEALLGRRLASAAAQAAALRQLAAQGVALPVLSDGARGLVALAQGRLWRAQPPRLQVVNSVGSGDAAVAGFAAALARNPALANGAAPAEFAAMLRLAAACGSANVLTAECASVRAPDVRRLRPQIRIRVEDSGENPGAAD